MHIRHWGACFQQWPIMVACFPFSTCSPHGAEMWGYNKTPLVYYHGNVAIILKGNSLKFFVLLLNIAWKYRNRFWLNISMNMSHYSLSTSLSFSLDSFILLENLGDTTQISHPPTPSFCIITPVINSRPKRYISCHSLSGECIMGEKHPGSNQT